MNHQLLASLLLVPLLLSCSPGAPAADEPKAAVEAPQPAADESSPAVAPTFDSSKYESADALWKHIDDIQRGPDKAPSSHEEAATMFRSFLQEMRAATAEFIRRYPEDPRQWEARFFQLQALEMEAQFSGRPADPSVREKLLQEILAAEQAPATAKTEARFMMILHRATALENGGTAEAAAAVDQEILAFQKEYPDDQRSDFLRFLRAMVYEKIDAAKHQAMLEELSKSQNPMLAMEARKRLSQMKLAKEPLDLKFTALDGSTVDLAKLRGKVVLLDFWATWCAPCIMDMPSVISLYQKYHDQGLEIVGISLDEDKARLQAMVKDKEITWPQYFDGKGFEGEISARFGITAIPAKWLVDKQGYARSAEAVGNLDPLVEKLLRE